MDIVHAKEESKRLREQLTDMRAKLADLEAKVRYLQYPAGGIVAS